MAGLHRVVRNIIFWSDIGVEVSLTFNWLCGVFFFFAPSKHTRNRSACQRYKGTKCRSDILENEVLYLIIEQMQEGSGSSSILSLPCQRSLFQSSHLLGSKVNLQALHSLTALNLWALWKALVSVQSFCDVYVCLTLWTVLKPPCPFQRSPRSIQKVTTLLSLTWAVFEPDQQPQGEMLYANTALVTNPLTANPCPMEMQFGLRN